MDLDISEELLKNIEVKLETLDEVPDNPWAVPDASEFLK